MTRVGRRRLGAARTEKGDSVNGMHKGFVDASASAERPLCEVPRSHTPRLPEVQAGVERTIVVDAERSKHAIRIRGSIILALEAHRGRLMERSAKRHGVGNLCRVGRGCKGQGRLGKCTPPEMRKDTTAQQDSARGDVHPMGGETHRLHAVAGDAGARPRGRDRCERVCKQHRLKQKDAALPRDLRGERKHEGKSES